MGDEKSPVSWQVDVIQKLGFPTVFSCAILWMLWRGCSWLGTEVLLPLYNKQVVFIESATAMTGSMQVTTTEMNATLSTYGKTLEDQVHTYEAIVDATEVNTELIRQNQDLLKKLTNDSSKQLDVLERIENNTDPKHK
jgi:hypothetical protein